MHPPLLTTKLHRPAPRQDLVDRPHLHHRLDEALCLSHKLILVSAPAGFGKTTLVATWLASSEQHASHAAWLSLDDKDNETSRFWTYIIAALNTVDEDLGKGALIALRASQRPPLEEIITQLINDLNQHSTPLLLVLDDFHTIRRQELHASLAFLMEHAPPHLHLIITSRTDPPLPLPRLRGRRQITEVRAAQLRFSEEEAVALFNRVLDLDLSEDEIDALETRTEGWITGLQLAALTLRGRPDAAAFIREFAGSNRYVLDYLVEEVLHRQPEHLQAFLLQTSILDRLTSGLCEAVTGHDDSAGTLAQLEHDNLFLVPLDDKRQWYRYHHLFADLLRHQLTAIGQHLGCAPEQTLHRRASVWYQDHDLPDEAIHHAFASGDTDRAADLIDDAAPACLARGELPRLLAWLERLPDGLLHRRPELCLHAAWVRLLNGRWDLALPHLERAEQLAPTAPSTDRRDAVLGAAASIRAYRAVELPDAPSAVEHAQEALDRLPDDDAIGRSIAAYTLGNARRLGNDLEGAADAFSEAIALGRAADVLHIVAPSVSALCRIHVSRGQLRRAARTCREAIENLSALGGDLPPIAADICGRLGDLHYEWNELDTALRYLKRGVELGRANYNAGLLASNYVSLARGLRAHGDTAQADDALRAASDLCRERGIHPRIVNLLTARKGLLTVARRDAAAAKAWIAAHNLSADDGPTYARLETYVTLSQVLTFLSRPDQALTLLTRLRLMSQEAGCTGDLIGIQACQALALRARGEHDAAVSALADAVRRAKPEGYVRTFVDRGASIGELLRRVALRGTHPNYVGKLLAAVEAAPPVPLKPNVDAANEALIEPLTDRELEVLRLIAAGLSNADIADQLYIAVSTVKKHINHLYGKLEVHRRTQAVARARELDLL